MKLIRPLGALAAAALMAASLATSPASAALPAGFSAKSAAFCSKVTPSNCTITVPLRFLNSLNGVKTFPGAVLEADLRGNPNATTSVAIYRLDGTTGKVTGVTKMSKDATVTTNANGSGTARITVPEIDPNVPNGERYFVGISDITDQQVVAKKFIAGLTKVDTFAIYSKYATVDKVTKPSRAGDPFFVTLNYALPGDVFAMQIKRNGQWTTLPSGSKGVPAANGKISSTGTGVLQFAAPSGLKRGSYPSRLYNVTKKVATPKNGTLYIGTVAPTPSPSPTSTPTSTSTPEPSPTATQPNSPAPTGDRPGLPKTGN